ncbi:hypothetical protein E2C11_10125 [Streptomyces lavendulae]|nr:hypothetical protein [Streptomyces lavendulae]TXJ82077.1 hypothetical protein E2C11_10125 [Streptomyces lavendulae]
MRLRIRVTNRPRRALALIDTPRPDCPLCHGTGGHAWEYTTPDGEYDGSDFEPCTCWNDTWHLTLLPLPHRTPPGGYSNEPPF